MKQKSVLFLAASWLVVRLRLALLSTKSLVANLRQKPGVILIVPRHAAMAEHGWRWDGTRIHCIHIEPEHANIQVRSFPEMSSN